MNDQPPPDADGPQQAHDLPSVLARTTIPLGTAVIVGVFAALGIEGDALARLIRNKPGTVGWLFTLAIVALTVPLVLQIWRHVDATSRWIKLAAVAGAVLLMAAAIWAVQAGADGVAEREQPHLALRGQLDPASGVVVVTVEATASSVASDQKMLLRVLAVSQNVTNPYDVCSVPSEPKGPRTSDPPQVILFWGETGPTSTGDVAAGQQVGVSPKQFGYVCALASLKKVGPNDKNPRYSVAILDLTAMDAKGPTPAAPTGSGAGNRGRSTS